MSKSLLIPIIVVAVLAVGGLLYWLAMPSGALIYNNRPAGQSQQGINPSPIAAPPPTSQETSPQKPLAIPPPTSSPAQSTASVAIQNFQFNPASLTVKLGTKVIWTNNDSVPHTVTADQGSEPMSRTLIPGGDYSYIFSATGTFDYHCSIHPSMHGSVTVTQ